MQKTLNQNHPKISVKTRMFSDIQRRMPEMSLHQVTKWVQMAERALDSQTGWGTRDHGDKGKRTAGTSRLYPASDCVLVWGS